MLKTRRYNCSLSIVRDASEPRALYIDKSVKSHPIVVPFMEKDKSHINIDLLDSLLDYFPNTEDADDSFKMVFYTDFHCDNREPKECKYLKLFSNLKASHKIKQ